MMASPRRALAPLDANRPSPSPAKLKSPMKNILGADLLSKQRPVLSHVSPTKERKRALEVEERAVKRSCLEASPQSVTVCSSTVPFRFCTPCAPLGRTRAWLETDVLGFRGISPGTPSHQTRRPCSMRTARRTPRCQAWRGIVSAPRPERYGLSHPPHPVPIRKSPG